jgi:hypothetical protein
MNTVNTIKNMATLPEKERLLGIRNEILPSLIEMNMIVEDK